MEYGGHSKQVALFYSNMVTQRRYLETYLNRSFIFIKKTNRLLNLQTLFMSYKNICFQIMQFVYI